jgi:hypothetical protein
MIEVREALMLARWFAEHEADQRGREDDTYDLPAATLIQKIDAALDALQAHDK